ncbi:MAG: nicotinamide-nucleotide amidohydrolase family protein [Gammaproteobacteria bacterium]
MPTAVDDRSLLAMAADLASHLRSSGRSVASAESCTGGWIAKVLTDLPGSSEWFGYGIVSYSNAAKQELLGVPAATLIEHGAVSEPVVMAMAEGLLRRSDADLAVAVSGVAGPAGGSADKPVGLVWFAWAVMGENGLMVKAGKRQFDGDRDAVRRQSVATALQGLLEL